MIGVRLAKRANASSSSGYRRAVAAIHVVTAALLASLVIVGTALISGAALNRFIPAAPVFDVSAAAALVVFGLVLTASATVVPTVLRLREPLARRLSVE